MTRNRIGRRIVWVGLVAVVVAISGLAGCDSSQSSAPADSKPSVLDSGGLNQKGKVIQIPGRGKPAPKAAKPGS